MTDLKHLRELCDAATYGKWFSHGVFVSLAKEIDAESAYRIAVAPMAFTRAVGFQTTRSNMDFIAATDPQTVIGLIDEIERLRDIVIDLVDGDRRHKQHRINLIASVYGKDRARWFTEQIEKGRLLYADKEKALRWSQSARLQLPGEVTATRHTRTIPRRPHEVKDYRRSKAPTIPKKKGHNDENQ